MRRLMVVLAVLTLGVMFGSMTARAATSTVTLDPSSPITVTFTAGGGTVSFAPTSGSASGGPGLLAAAMSYSLSGGPVALTNVVNSSPFAGYTASGAPITFDLNGGALLTGTIDLVSAAEFPGSGGVSIVSTLADLNITGGTICAHIVCGDDVGNVLLNLVLPLGTFLPNTLSNTQATLVGGTGTIGSITLLGTTPEPSSMLLCGTGFLLFGTILRRRLLSRS